MTKDVEIIIWENYGGLSLYDIYIWKICTIEDEEINFVNKYVYD